MIYQFADCRLDVGRLELRRAGRLVPLEPQVFGVLAYLVEHRERVVPKEELLDQVWGHRFVGDAALVSRIMAARKAVGDSGREQRLIKTLHGRGYRFAGDVVGAAPEPPPGGDGPALAGDPGGGANGAPHAEGFRVEATSRGAAPAGDSGNGANGAGPESGAPLPPLAAGTLTFLVADPERAAPPAGEPSGAPQAALARHRELLRQAVEGHSGRVLEAVGDAVCAAFARPTDAVAAALAAQLALRREDWGATGLRAPLRARMGLHTGEGVQAAAGAVPDHGARLAREAHPGQVLLSAATAALVRDALPAGAALRDLGAHRLEGGWPAEHLHQLVPPEITGTFPALRAAEGRPHNLPRPLTGLVGREREAADVQRLLAESPLVTLAGPGGAGKTRLALRVAADVLADTASSQRAGRLAGPDVPDGVWFVDLAPLADGALVPQAVAAAVGVREVPGQPLAGVLAGALREQALLLVLDNCEHLLDACALLVETLLRAAPRLRVLATSREPLRAAGEAVYRVPPLAAPAAPPAPGPAEATVPAEAPDGPEAPELVASYPAVRLFVARARAVRPDFAVTAENAAAVAAVCDRLDGLPLAIELAAARARVLTPQQMAARLDDRLALLTGGARTAGWRQQTLRATLDWSHALLSPPEQALFRRLAVFAGGWTLEAAEAVGGADGGGTGGAAAVLDLLTSLVDKSLVEAEVEAEVEAGGAVRYRLLQTVRQYAAERLEQSGAAGSVRASHARYYLDLAEGASAQLLGAAQARWHGILEAEHDNLRAALAWCVQQADAARALRFAAALSWFWYRRRHWDEGYTWPARALALPGEHGQTPLRADVLEGAGLFAMWRDPPAAQAMWEECIAIRLRHNMPAGAAQAHAFLAWLLIRLGRLDEAQHRAAAALSLTEEARDHGRRSLALALLGAVAARRGQHAVARVRHEEALAIRRASGDASGRSLLLLDMAKAALLAGDLGRTRALAEEALRTAREAGIRQAMDEELRLLARAALAQEDLPAAELWATQLVAHVKGQSPVAEVDALALLGQVAQAAGALGRAAGLYRTVLDLARRLPDPGEDHPVLYRDTGDQPGVAVALEGAAALIAPDRPALALRLAGAAAAHRQRARQPLSAAERAALDRHLAGARSRLGPARASRLQAEGGQSGAVEILTLALEALAAAPLASEEETAGAPPPAPPTPAPGPPRPAPA